MQIKIGVHNKQNISDVFRVKEDSVKEWIYYH